jgi:cell division protein FtsQ
MRLNAGRFSGNATGLLALLLVCALLLVSRVTYLLLDDAKRFPINTVKISAGFQQVSRNELELILKPYLNYSFFMLPVDALENKLLALNWIQKVCVTRHWPDILSISIEEKNPVAFWNNALMTEQGEVFRDGQKHSYIILPHLQGPEHQQQDVLQNYQKLSKLLSGCGLQISGLRLRENQAWELLLSNGVKLHLGKQHLDQRIMRFCKAYPVLFADKSEQLSGVDLRYSYGMAVRWKKS